MTVAYAIIGVLLGAVAVIGLTFAWWHNRQPGE